MIGRFAAAAALTGLGLVGCMAEETERERRRAFESNVESCVCRSLDYEVDQPGRISWQRLVERCNRVVYAANPQRYSAEFRAAPALDGLRCLREAEAWRAEHGGT